MSCTKHVLFVKWYLRNIFVNKILVIAKKVDETNEQFSKNECLKLLRHHEMFECTFFCSFVVNSMSFLVSNEST